MLLNLDNLSHCNTNLILKLYGENLLRLQQCGGYINLQSRMQIKFDKEIGICP